MTTVRELWRQRDNKLLVLLASAPVLYMLYFYGGSAALFGRLFGPGLSTTWWDIGSTAYRYAVACLTLGVLPALIIKLVFHDRLGGYGLGRGDARYNLLFVLLGALVVIPLGYISSRNPEFRALSPQLHCARGSASLFLLSSGLYLLYYVGYEVFFRGYLLFGIEKRLGPWPAILITTMTTTLVHITRPAGEYAAALIAGFIFGYVALRTRSIWGVLALHFITGVSLDFFCAFL
jgi:membrane protease YdiL (CAAX protease family)